MPRLSKPIDPTRSDQTDRLTLAEAVSRWTTSLQAENKSPRTLQAYTYALTTVQDILPTPVGVSDIGPENIDAVIVALQARGWRPSSVSAVERPLRSFLKWCVVRGYLTRSPMEGRKPVTVPVEAVQFPSVDELRKVVATTVTRSKWAFRARRDRAILLLFISTGARLAEVAGLKVSDVAVDVPFPFVSVLGKGRKPRHLPLDEATAEALRTYLRLERPRSAYSGSPALWLAPRGPMTANGVAQVIRDRATSVGVSLHPHALRHFAIHSMLATGMQEGEVMKVSGHTTRAMLDRYGAMLAAERADAAFRATAAKRQVA